MAKFLIYLFESGLCLSLFYSGYILFFRKETYFNFNRFYLLISMLLALLLPLCKLTIPNNSGEYIGLAIDKVGTFKNYYEELISMTEPNFIVADALTIDTNSHNIGGMININSGDSSSFNWSSILFYTYIAGLLFFGMRLLVLIVGLIKLVRRNVRIKKDGFTIVLINNQSPSFSFMRWVFINKHQLNPEEYEQVIAHEKVHVQHKHSMDLLLAHIITIFQWFNPLTWRIQKSIKTCHEYIADRQVIDQGHELFDYQSLLLSQLISIRSVELVNNFNLLSIKKRIAMMNKIKSGTKAKMKALLVVPMLVVVFFFFADMTGKTLVGEKKIDNQPIVLNSESIIVPTHVVNNSNEAVGNTDVGIRDVKMSGFDDAKKPERLEYIKGHYEINLLNKESSANLNKEEQPIVNLPKAKAVKLYDESYVLSKVILTDSQCFIGDDKVDVNYCNDVLHKLSKQENDGRKSIILEIDVETPMEDVDKIKDALRLNDLLKIAYAAEADKSLDLKGGPTAIVNLLPPKDAKMLTKEEAFFEGIKMFTIDSNTKLKNVARRLSDHIEASKKYVILYEYNNNTSYNDYIQTLDVIYSTVWKLRKEYAFNSGIDYDTMTKEQEKKLRKKYPLTLTMKNIDSDN